MSFIIQCWVPDCPTSKNLHVNADFLPLPKSHKYKETWLALAGKKVTIPEKHIFFCGRHFSKPVDKPLGKLLELNPMAIPFYHMPTVVCKTCRSIIPRSGLFTIVSETIPSSVPQEITAEFGICRPEPLYQILTFCIPNLSLERNPPSLVCLNCYQGIWLYFMFKLKCNNTESTMRGKLPLEQYGRLLLCRSCPEMTGTKFFILTEEQPLGLIYKGMFLTNYPTNIVPLKMCLKCYNTLHKINQFRDLCFLSDEMTKRCAKLNNTTITVCNNQPEISVSKLKLLNLNEKIEKEMIKSHQSTSWPARDGVSSGSASSVFKKRASEQPVTEPGLKKLSDNSNKCNIRMGIGSLEVDPEMPTLYHCEDIRPELRPTTSAVNIPRMIDYSEYKARIDLAHLMLKHKIFSDRKMSARELAEKDLEMWVNVVRDFHCAGHSYTLEGSHNLWNSMKSCAKAAHSAIGPLTYLDYLVMCHLTDAPVQPPEEIVIIVDDFVESNQRNDRVDLSITTDKKEATATFNQGRTTVIQCNNIFTGGEMRLQNCTPKKSASAINDCEVICIDDDDDEVKEKNIPEKGAINVDRVKQTCDISKRNENSAIGINSAETLRNVRIPKRRRVESTEITVSPDSPEDTSQSNPRKSLREPFTIDKKLELVRKMKKELDSLIEEKKWASLKTAPWKRIIEKLSSEDFFNCTFKQLYYIWGKMRISAIIYEKDGRDRVDVEVWELMQLYVDTQKRLNKEGGRKSEEGKVEGCENSNLNADKLPDPNRHSDTQTSKDDKSHNPNSPSTAQTSVKKIATKSTLSKKPPKERKKYTNTGIAPLADQSEFIDLIQKEFDKMIDETGRIDIINVLRNMTYKNYLASTMKYTWRQFLEEGSKKVDENPSELQQKVRKLVKVYYKYKKQRKVNVVAADNKSNATKKKTKTTSKSDASRGSKGRMLFTDEDKLALIALMKTFGHEALKNKENPSVSPFWRRVVAQFKWRRSPESLCKKWKDMLTSAKLSWAQEDRVPQVGDREIIEFMTGVIRDKEKVKEDQKENVGPKNDKATEEMLKNGANEDEGDIFEEGEEDLRLDLRTSVHEATGEDLQDEESLVIVIDEEIVESDENREPVSRDVPSSSNSTASGSKSETSEDSEKDYSIGDYEYVSLEDLVKQNALKGLEKLPPVGAVNDVIEIPDSDED